MQLKIQQQHFVLHHSGAIYWEDYKILLIADVHLGKVTHFRKHGIAVPKDSANENFNRLGHVIEDFQPEKVCFLGDLFHSYENTEWLRFKDFIQTYPAIHFILVKGNHDIIPASRYFQLHIKVENEFIIDEFLLTHHPEERENFFNFCGHIHPAVQLQGVGKQSITLRCFLQKPQQMILPVFGNFTGNYTMRPSEHDQVFVIGDSEVVSLQL